MKNLFDYATKELSQDAFLRWFIESWDDKEDKALQSSAIDFLIFLTENKLSIDPNKAKIITHSQVSHIDITIDIFPDKNSDIHDVIVIEDKVYSSEHNQLVAYNKAISNWKDARNIYKVFYKTSLLSDEDRKGIENANEGQKDKWIAFDIKKIWEEFFVNRGASSQIFNNYVDYIKRIYDNCTKISDKPTAEWDTNNWKTFLEEKVKKDFPNLSQYVMHYRGMYNSLLLNYFLENNNYLKCATLEFIVRDTIKPYFHPSFCVKEDGKEKWEWSTNQLKEPDVKKEALEELEKLRNCVSQCKSTLLQRGNTSRSFAKTKKEIKHKELQLYSDDVWEELKKIILEYVRILDKYVAS